MNGRIGGGFLGTKRISLQASPRGPGVATSGTLIPVLRENKLPRAFEEARARLLEAEAITVNATKTLV